MNEFISMSGYGFYVWTAYLSAGLVLGWLAIGAIRRNRFLRRCHDASDRDGHAG